MLGSTFGLLIFRILNDLNLKAKYRINFSPQNHLCMVQEHDILTSSSGLFTESEQRHLSFLCCNPPIIICGCEDKQLWILFLKFLLSYLLPFGHIFHTQSSVACILHTHTHTHKTFPQSKEVEILVYLKLNWVWLWVLQIKAVAACNHCPI